MSRLPLAALLAGRDPCVVALVGGGGKTSLMFALARVLSASGQRVICTTSTKIYPPSVEQSQSLVLMHPEEKAFSRSLAELAEALALNRQATVAHGLVLQGEMDSTGCMSVKLKGLSPVMLDRLSGTFPDAWILVEADGAAMRPLKISATHEPAVPPCTSICVAVLGLDALGQPFGSSVVHRAHLWSCLTEMAPQGSMIAPRPGEPLTWANFVCLVEHPEGLFRTCPAGCERVVFANKADTIAFARNSAPEVLSRQELFRKKTVIGTDVELKKGSSPAIWYVGSVHEGWYEPAEDFLNAASDG